MFCIHCGGENEEGAKFCIHCGETIADDNTAAGESIQQSDAPQSTNKAEEIILKAVTDEPGEPKTPKMPMHPKTKRLIVILAVAVVGVIAFFSIGNMLFSPERVAEMYVNAKVERDGDRLYDLLAIPESQFTSKEQFLSAQTKYIEYEEEEPDSVTVFSVNPISSKNDKEANGKDQKLQDDKSKISLEFFCETKNGERYEEIPISLVRQGKALLFFDQYKVVPNDFLAKKYTISVPEGVNVTLDGISIGEKYLAQESIQEGSKDENGYTTIQNKTYVLKNLFSGTHTLSATGAYFADYSEEIYVPNAIETKQLNLELKAEIAAQIQQTATETAQLLFDAKAEGKPFSEIQQQLNIAPSRENVIAQAYENLYDGLGSNASAEYSNIKLTGLSNKSGGVLLTEKKEAPLACKLGIELEAKQKLFFRGTVDTQLSDEISFGFSYDKNELKLFSIPYNDDLNKIPIINTAAQQESTQDNEVVPSVPPQSDAGSIGSSDKILPEVGQRYYSETDILNLMQPLENNGYATPAALRLARNECYANYGLVFQDESLNEYFYNQRGSIYSRDSFATVGSIESKFNVYEKANIDAIKALEGKTGL